MAQGKMYTKKKKMKSKLGKLKLVRDVLDAVGLDLSMECRAKILYALTVNHNQKRKLASEKIPVTEFLFGNDLKFLSATDSSSKLGFSMTTPRGRKYFPSHTQKWSVE